jgi:TolA-binding protein
MILAQIPDPDPDFFWQWLRSLAASVVFAYYVMRLWKGASGSAVANTVGPQPFMVEAVKRFATQEELDRVTAELRADMNTLEDRIKELDARIGESQTEIIHCGEERAVALHKRIDNFQEHTNEQLNVVSGKLGELVGQLKQMNRA